MQERPYYTYTKYLKNKYGKTLYKIGVDADFSCPNREKNKTGGCIFCDGTGSLAVYQREEDKDLDIASSIFLKRLKSMDCQIQRGLNFAKYRYKADLFALYFQSFSNTYASVDELKKIYDNALAKADFTELIIATRPDLVDRPVLELLKTYKDKVEDVYLELGLQSAKDETLEYINRGHDLSSYINAVNLAHEYGIKVTTHIMLLPSLESLDDYLNTVKVVNMVASDAIKIHNLHVMRNTKLEKLYLSGEVTLASVERHVKEVATILAHLNENIVVQRVLTETPKQRLVAPRHYPDKRDILEMIDKFMFENNMKQGSKYIDE